MKSRSVRIPKERPTGSEREIPVDDSGHVPVWALVQRFQEVGNIASDQASDSAIVLSGDLTPEDVEDWWNDPSCCDIKGIDDSVHSLYSVPASIQGGKRKALSKLCVLAPRGESNRIKKILADSFSESELAKMVSEHGFFITTEDYMPDCTGYYLRVQDGVPVAQIVLENKTTPDGVVHEVVHHLRAKDGRAAFPTDEHGALVSSRFYSLPKAEQDELVRQEERETVAETLTRTRIDPVQSGYYDTIPGKDSREAYLEDQQILSGGKRLKGKAVYKSLEENYGRTNIARAVVTENRKSKSRKKTPARGGRR